MLPEVKDLREGSGKTSKFDCIKLDADTTVLSDDDLRELLEMKLWNYAEIKIVESDHNKRKSLILKLSSNLLSKTFTVLLLFFRSALISRKTFSNFFDNFFNNLASRFFFFVYYFLKINLYLSLTNSIQYRFFGC